MAVVDPNAGRPKRKRRWLQFSLRSLMIFTLVVAIPCAWLGHRIEEKRRERQAVAAIVKLGGGLRYDYENAPGKVPLEPPGPRVLRSLLGENYFCEVDAVSLGLSVWHPSS